MKRQDSLNQSDKTVNFWLCAGLLAILLASTLARDITRPFTGLHSWAQASGAWAARSHARYGLGYTKGVSTFAVGQPPAENPKRYWDHPQLSGLLAGLTMKILGVNEWSLRFVGVFMGLLGFLLFLRILRGLVDDLGALLAGLIFVLFPLTGYFSVGGWITLAVLGSIWSYLVIIGGFQDGPEPKTRHKIILAICLFAGLQLSWLGFFYAFAIGSHYVLLCVFRKRKLEIGLLSILFFAPVFSMLLTFVIMAAGYDWDIGKIVELYKWRSSKGEMQQMQGFDWGAWFNKLWEFCVQDFTAPVLILSIAYLVFGQLFVFMEREKSPETGRRLRQFPQPWLFIFPAILFLAVFRGLVWRHQYWLRPLAFPLAISAGMAILLVGDFVKKINRKFSIIVMVAIFVIIFGYCIKGTNYFHSIRWQPQAKIDMFKKLNQRIPPDKALLSFEPFIVNQHKSKGGFIRPEIAWYLDREIVPARSVEEIKKYASTGRYPYYLIPVVNELSPLIAQLQKRYKFEYIPGVQGERTKDGKFLKAGMMPYVIFDLNAQSPK